MSRVTAVAIALARLALPALAACAVLGALAPPTGAQEPARLSRTFEEVRAIAAVRDKARNPDRAATAAAAQAYLAQYEQGEYRDEALLILGEAQAAQNKNDEALKTLRILIDQYPNSPFREYALADSYPLLRQTGANDDANQRLSALLKEYPRGLTRTRTRLWEGREKGEAGDTQGMIAALEPLARDDLPSAKDRAEYDRLLGMAFVNTGQRDKAEPYLKRYAGAEDSAANKAPVLMMLADEARQARRLDQALDYYRQIVEKYPHPPLLPAARYWRADLFSRTILDRSTADKKAGNRERAVTLYSAYLDSGDTEFASKALQRRAELLAESGQNEAALKDYERLQTVDPATHNEPAIVGARANLLVKLKREPEALALLNQAGQNPDLSPSGRGGLLIEQVRMNYQQENCGEVLRLLRPLPAFDSAEQINRAIYMRGFCYYRMSQWEEASADLEHLARFPEQLPTVWEPLVECYEKSGQFSRLVRFLEEQIQAKRIQPTAQTYHQLANGYERLNQPALVIATYKKLQQQQPEALNTTEALIRIGKAEEALGQTDQALAHYESALTLTPSTEAQLAAYRDTLGRLEGLLRRGGRWERLTQRLNEAQAVLTTPEDRERLRQSRRQANLGWGKADTDAGLHVQAASHLETAWQLTPQDDPPARLETLAILAASYRRGGQLERAVDAYQAELERSQDSLYRVQLEQALGRFYREWAASEESGKGIESALPLYENALAHLPESDWESRYQIVLKLDPVYQQQGRHDRLIGYLEQLERAATDRQFRADLRKYRLSLYRIWAAKLVQSGQPEEASRQLQFGMQLMLSGSNWSGLGELAGARAELAREDREFEQQIASLREAEARAPDIASREEARQALLATRLHWGAFKESRNDPDGALAQYDLALARLTPADWTWLRDLSLRAAAVRRGRGEHERATTQIEALLPLAPAGAERDALREQLVQSQLAWGKALEQSGQPALAEEQYRKALGLVDKSQWARRNEIVQAIGQLQLNAGETRALVTLYEGLRSDAPDAATAKQLDEFLGQLYIKWAEEAFRAKKYEFARQRYHHAIDLLPKDRWELRLGAAKKLEGIYAQEKDLKSVTELYAHLVPEISEPKVWREYALYLARLYWDKAQQADPAQKWLKAADSGEADAVSVEAGYILSEIAAAKKQPAKAKSILENLANRQLDGSTWYVPIHYQLAVLLHREDKLREALRHYRAVVAAETAETLKLYPKAIRESKAQSIQLDQYLKIRGGEAGDEVKTPSLKQRPPTPGRKSR